MLTSRVIFMSNLRARTCDYGRTQKRSNYRCSQEANANGFFTDAFVPKSLMMFLEQHRERLSIPEAPYQRIEMGKSSLSVRVRLLRAKHIHPLHHAVDMKALRLVTPPRGVQGASEQNHTNLEVDPHSDSYTTLPPGTEVEVLTRSKPNQRVQTPAHGPCWLRGRILGGEPPSYSVLLDPLQVDVEIQHISPIHCHGLVKGVV